ncbi:MAG: ribonuclease III domain-containing protein [Bacillota bacterium]|nr:ribonuclease III domain-containing protein [Bacillota bacterium]
MDFKWKPMSPLKLAFLGDAVFEQYVRHHLVVKLDVNTHELARFATRFVKARAQFQILMDLEPQLTEEERDIVRRGRNQKPKTVPKNAVVAEYRYATGYEALIGYLFLSGQNERLQELIDHAIGFVMGMEENESNEAPAKIGEHNA